jgi:hypothetical protein
MDKIPRDYFPTFFNIVSQPRFGENPACRKGLYAQAIVPDKNILSYFRKYIIVLVRVSSKQREKRGGSVLISRWGFTKKNN